MTREMLLVQLILAVTVVLFLSNRLKPDLVALLSLLALYVTGILTLPEALAGFGDPSVVMIAGLFVVAGGILRTGLAERFGILLGRIAGAGRARATAVVMIGPGLLSAFVSTTGTVALMLPVTASLARNAGISPSLLLIPLAIGALFGGLLTLIATPPNIIVSNQLSAAGFEPFRFFDFTPIGLVLLGLGTLVLMAFGGRLLRPRAPVDRPVGASDVLSVAGRELVSGYSLEPGARLRVMPGSPLAGTSVAAAELRSRYAVNIAAIRRRRSERSRMQRVPRTAEETISIGDELDVHGTSSAIRHLAREQRLDLVSEAIGSEADLAEVLLTPRSRLIGKTLADLQFRSRYGVNVLSIRRQSGAVEGPLANVSLRFADTLLVAGSSERIDLLRSEPGDFVVIGKTGGSPQGAPLSRREGLALTILAGMLLMLGFEVLEPAMIVMLAGAAMVLFGCLDMSTAYEEINWGTVLLIAAILPMATALQKTGSVDLIVAQLRPIGALGPVAMLTALFILTVTTGMFISNTATAALVAPIALGAALEMGISPYPLLMTVAVAASSSFTTPISTPANMLVLAPGDYRFSDYVRVGLPLQLIAGIVTVLLVPFLFPF